jgi:hypothetical protein
MKLSQITSAPKLIEMTLDDKDTIKEYGEPLTFWTYDRQPMEVFMQLANMHENDGNKIIEIVKTLILDENGNQVLTDDQMLPTGVLMKTIAKVTSQLGK